MSSRLVLVAVLALCVPALVLPSTWADVEVTCPVCGTVNIFKVPASFGTYVSSIHRDSNTFFGPRRRTCSSTPAADVA